MDSRLDKLRAWHKRLRASLGMGGAGAALREPDSAGAADEATVSGLEKALEYLQQGKLDQAQAIYREILEKQPLQAEALHLLGVVQAQRQNLAEAAQLIGRALRIAPDNAGAHLNLGNILKALHKSEEALASYDRALVLNPGSAEGHNNRGAVLGDLGRHEEALGSYGRALEVAPDYVEALLNRGRSLLALKRHEEALAAFERVLASKPDHREALIKRGAALATLRRFDDALASHDRALAIRPDDLEALFNRGVVLVELKRFAEAVASYDQVIAVNPDMAEVHNNRGIAFWHGRQYEDAVASYDRALALRPEYTEVFFNRAVALSHMNRKTEELASYDRAVALNPQHKEALYNRGVLLSEMKRYDDALASYDRVLEIDPDFTDALSNRGGAFCALKLHERAAMDYSRLLELDPDYEYALGNKHSSDMHCCNWTQYHSMRERLGNAVREGKCASFTFSFLVMSDAGAEQLQCARTYAAHRFPVSARPLWTGERYRHQRIRLAYLSADFHNHATAYLMAELFEKHDRKKFEVSGWSFGPEASDNMRKRLQNSFDSFHDVRQVNDVEVAHMLHAQEIDIAVDLKGYTQDSRTAIFFHKAAPIQVNYLVYPGTMGADFMDYIIGDAVVIPAGHEAFYSEQVVRLPDSYQVNDSKRAISPGTPSRREAGLPEAGFVFCCFNKNYKIVPEVFDIWMRLLQRVEGSVLWLFDDNAAAVRNLRAEAESRGVRANRLVFASHMPLADHLARHRLADLFLDTLPCNAHTTASDALWAGLPVLTCLGHAFAGRVAASLLHAIGLPELVTENLADYEALAYQLATMPARLADIRARLARNKTTHPLFDIDRSTRHVESAYVGMYERYQRGEPAQGFSVQPLS